MLQEHTHSGHREARCLADTMKGKGNEHCTREAKDVVGDVVCRFEGALELSFAAAEH